MKTIRRISMISLILWASGFAYGHMMWLNSSNYYPGFHPKSGASTIIYFGWGHRYPVGDFLDQEMFLEKFYFVCPRCGKLHPLNPNPGGFLATQVKFEESGSYWVCAELKSGFYTMYMKKGKMHHELGPKTGLKNVIMSLWYKQWAKALINVGVEDTFAYNKPVGHEIEIVPLKNPMTLREGDFLPIQVLFKGKPVSFCEVHATYSGFSTGEEFAYATSTDREGKAKIRILHYGIWLVKAEKQLPPEVKLRDKCDMLHYTATFTFEVK
ncbi:DUF4198 domain-containing protein [candidate division WOR-3 bacterium]|nr:DUF4198 domain-containing protein [candidate division WOR-3 bacterium]